MSVTSEANSATDKDEIKVYGIAVSLLLLLEQFVVCTQFYLTHENPWQKNEQGQEPMTKNWN